MAPTLNHFDELEAILAKSFQEIETEFRSRLHRLENAVGFSVSN